MLHIYIGTDEKWQVFAPPTPPLSSNIKETPESPLPVVPATEDLPQSAHSFPTRDCNYCQELEMKVCDM